MSLHESHVYHLYRGAKDRNALAFFGTFLRLMKSLIQAYFSWEHLGLYERGHPELGLDIFFEFSTVKAY